MRKGWDAAFFLVKTHYLYKYVSPLNIFIFVCILFQHDIFIYWFCNLEQFEYKEEIGYYNPILSQTNVLWLSVFYSIMSLAQVHYVNMVNIYKKSQCNLYKENSTRCSLKPCYTFLISSCLSMSRISYTETSIGCGGICLWPGSLGSWGERIARLRLVW